ncbi:MAG: hypothetical protein Q6K35_11820, partial [Thermostichus sp. DG02_4_bins_136]
MKGVAHQPGASWVLWKENGKYPDIELLSDFTAKVNRTFSQPGSWCLYLRKWKKREQQQAERLAEQPQKL